MENLSIKASKNTPQIDFSKEGKLAMSGSAYPENAKEFFDPIINWVTELKIEKIDLDMNLEYINTAAAKKILELLKTLEANLGIDLFHVRWHYEKGDEDGLETGQILDESLKRIKFDYIEF